MRGGVDASAGACWPTSCWPRRTTTATGRSAPSSCSSCASGRPTYTTARCVSHASNNKFQTACMRHTWSPADIAVSSTRSALCGRLCSTWQQITSEEEFALVSTGHEQYAENFTVQVMLANDCTPAASSSNVIRYVTLEYEVSSNCIFRSFKLWASASWTFLQRV
jgi:hypothetical protein